MKDWQKLVIHGAILWWSRDVIGWILVLVICVMCISGVVLCVDSNVLKPMGFDPLGMRQPEAPEVILARKAKEHREAKEAEEARIIKEAEDAAWRKKYKQRQERENQRWNRIANIGHEGTCDFREVKSALEDEGWKLTYKTPDRTFPTVDAYEEGLWIFTRNGRKLKMPVEWSRVKVEYVPSNIRQLERCNCLGDD